MAFASIEEKRAYHREYNRKRRATDPQFAAKERSATAKWASRNKSSRAIYQAEWRNANAEHVAQYNQQWRQENSEYGAEWRADNRGRCRAYLAAYRARKTLATPAWADMKAIEAIYIEAERMTRETGVPHEVDHIAPLFGKMICGLHVAGNLQVITATENRKKGNRYG